MQRVTIISTKPDFTDATVTIRNVNLPLLEKQRKAYLHFTPGNSSYKDEIDGLENFLNEICDTWYHQKDNPNAAPLPDPIPEREAVEGEGEPIFFLFGRDACRAYSEDGMESLAEYIKSGDGCQLYQYTGDPIDLISNFSGWDDYIIISKDEYQKISEL